MICEIITLLNYSTYADYPYNCLYAYMRNNINDKASD